MTGAYKFAIVLVMAAVLLSVSGQAMAQTQTAPTAPDTEVEAKGVGIAGGVMTGAEVVLLTESIVKVKPTWAWWVFPILGAGGGGVGGYFLEKNSTPGAIAMLVTSMAAVIPTSIAVASARAFDPELAGAKEGDSETMGAKFSFEQEPITEVQTGEAQTEVEARPEGMPDQVGPPASAAPAPEENVPVEDGAPVEDAAPADDAVPADGGEQSALEIHRRATVAHLSSGALLHLHPEYGFGIGVPVFDVRPVTFRLGENGQFREGVLFQLPLFSMNLP